MRVVEHHYSPCYGGSLLQRVDDDCAAGLSGFVTESAGEKDCDWGEG